MLCCIAQLLAKTSVSVLFVIVSRLIGTHNISILKRNRSQADVNKAKS